MATPAARRAILDLAQGHWAANPHGLLHAGDVCQAQMGSMGMDGDGPARECHHVRRRAFPLRCKTPRGQCLFPATADNDGRRNLRTTSTLKPLKEGIGSSFVAIVIDVQSAAIQLNHRFEVASFRQDQADLNGLMQRHLIR
jgi:hypothetical protein